MSLLERKNPFGPEEKTAPSVRNPVLEARPGRAAVAVVDAPAPASAFPSQARPVFQTDEERLTDDAAGPSTPRPRLALEAVPRVVSSAAVIRTLPLGPRDAFLLAHLDGASDLRTLIDVTGMTRLEISLVLEKLIDLGAVELS